MKFWPTDLFGWIATAFCIGIIVGILISLIVESSHGSTNIPTPEKETTGTS